MKSAAILTVSITGEKNQPTHQPNLAVSGMMHGIDGVPLVSQSIKCVVVDVGVLVFKRTYLLQNGQQSH